MTKFFKDVNTGDFIYFVNSTKDVSLIKSKVEKIHCIDGGRVAFDNDYVPFCMSLETLYKSFSKTSENLVIFTTQEEATEYYYSVISKIKEPTKLDETKTSDDNKEDFVLNYSDEDLNKMSFEEIKEAVNNMSLDEMLYHAAKAFGTMMGIKDPKIEVETSEDTDKEKISEKPSYYVPSYDEIRELERPKNLNENGGLKSIPAVLVITINEDGISVLDETHFDGVNPVFNGPKLYFHSVLIPDFDSKVSDEDIDEVYKAAENWIYENYPELENLEYGEEWHYDFLRPNDYTVDTENTINFNIFE